MTEPATLVQLIRQVRAQRQATDALAGERLRLEGSLIEFVEEAWPYVDAGMGVRMMRQGTRRAFSGNDPILAPSAAHRPQAIAKVGWFFGDTSWCRRPCFGRYRCCGWTGEPKGSLTLTP